MKCLEFKNWLLNRDIPEMKLNSAAKAHLADCSPCRKLHRLEMELERMVKNEFLTEKVPPGIVHRIETNLQRVKNPSIFTGFGFQKVIPAVTIPLIALFLVLSYLPGEFKNLQHISNLTVQYHLKSEYEIAFTQNELEKGNEMLNKTLGFKVIIPDLSAKGYQFIGGRKCTLGKRDVAYMFYKKQGHINSLFILNHNDLDFEMTEGGEYKDVNKGCTINIWKENSQVYALVN